MAAQEAAVPEPPPFTPLGAPIRRFKLTGMAIMAPQEPVLVRKILFPAAVAAGREPWEPREPREQEPQLFPVVAAMENSTPSLGARFVTQLAAVVADLGQVKARSAMAVGVKKAP